MSDTQQQTTPVKQSGGDTLITHLVCTGCEGQARPGAKALCGHVVATGKIPKHRRRQRCVVCADLCESHMETHK